MQLLYLMIQLLIRIIEYIFFTTGENLALAAPSSSLSNPKLRSFTVVAVCDYLVFRGTVKYNVKYKLYSKQ